MAKRPAKVIMDAQSQDFRLTWVNYSQKLTESFHKFLTSEILCNVTLWVHNGVSGSGGRVHDHHGPTGSNSIKAHQAILSACSPWFEEVLSQSQHPHPVIILKDVRYQDLKNIIRFIYTGEVFVPQHELQDFLRTAELLEIKGLLKDADDPSWTGLSSLFQPQASQLLASSPPGLLGGGLATAAAAAAAATSQPPQQKVVNIVNGSSGHVLGTAQSNSILPNLPTVPVSSLLLPSTISDGKIEV